MIQSYSTLGLSGPVLSGPLSCVWRSGNTLAFHARGRGSTPACRSDAPIRMIVFLLCVFVLRYMWVRWKSYG
jgi:hypothetical protein